VSDVVLKASGEHDGNSHVQDKSVHLTVSQRSTLKRAIKSAPNESARQLVRNSSNFSPGKRTGQDPDSIRSAQRLIAQERRSLALSHTSGVQLDTSNGAMTQLGDRMALEKLIARHNDPDDDYHLNLHQVVCIGNQWKKGVTFMEVSTPHFLFNAGRAMQTGWELQVQADGSFDFCQTEEQLIVLFTKETKQRVPLLSRDPSHPLDPKLLIPSAPVPLQPPPPNTQHTHTFLA
jgi:hypothetical protein